MLTPKEIAMATCDAGAAKAKLSIAQMIVLGIFAGVFIGFGAQEQSLSDNHLQRLIQVCRSLHLPEHFL